MSHSRRRKKKYVLGFIPKQAMPVVLVALGVLVIGGVVALILSTGPDPNYAPKVTGAPAIEVDESFIELGDMKFNTVADVTYTVRNVGDQILRITQTPQVEVLEGC